MKKEIHLMGGMPVELTSLRELRHPDGFISAASGLVFKADRFFVISDDELFLYEFDLNDKKHFRKMKLFEGELPEEKTQRKGLKPDLESLTLLPDGVLLAVPSGSKQNRQIGCRINENLVTHLDFSPLYRRLEKDFPELNIEGAVYLENHIKLFQRGNGSQPINAVITVDLDIQNVVGIETQELGQMKGLPLTFTDAALDAQKQIWFLAVAEDTTSTYEDGEFRGCVLGCLSNGKIVFQEALNCPRKPEGLWIEENQFYIVTDADSRRIPSELLTGSLPKI